MKKSYIVIVLILAVILIFSISYQKQYKDRFFVFKSGEYYVITYNDDDSYNIELGTQDLYLFDYYNSLGIYLSYGANLDYGKKINDDNNLGYSNPLFLSDVFYPDSERYIDFFEAFTDSDYLKYLLERAESGQIVKDWWKGVPKNPTVFNIVFDYSKMEKDKSLGFLSYFGKAFSWFSDIFGSVKDSKLFKN